MPVSLVPVFLFIVFLLGWISRGSNESGVTTIPPATPAELDGRIRGLLAQGRTIEAIKIRCLTATTLRRERVNDGARELRRCPRGSRRRVRARLALVQSPAVLQAVDAAARHGSRRSDGGRKDARGEAAHRAGAVPRSRLCDRAPRRAPGHQQLDGAVHFGLLLWIGFPVISLT